MGIENWIHWPGYRYRPFWEAVAKLGVPVFFTMGNGPADYQPSPTTAQLRRG
eukprot:COSAG05_NODE_6001_length_1042_cov_1.136797_1_plen_52_part_00